MQTKHKQKAEDNLRLNRKPNEKPDQTQPINGTRNIFEVPEGIKQ